LLRAKKLVTAGRDDVEMTPGGVLYGYDDLDRHQYDRSWLDYRIVTTDYPQLWS
jgi:hypothetical protein